MKNNILKMSFAVVASLLVLWAGVRAVAQHSAPDVTRATAVLIPTEGNKVQGTVTFTQAGAGVRVVAQIEGLTPGKHGFHIHEFGDCSAADGSSAGGHWNPMGHNHGKWNQAPFHMGDLGNVTADEYGNGAISITTSLWTIGTGQEDDIVGKSIVVHATADDFVTQPTGNAGGRIACGVIGT